MGRTLRLEWVNSWDEEGKSCNLTIALVAAPASKDAVMRGDCQRNLNKKGSSWWVQALFRGGYYWHASVIYFILIIILCRDGYYRHVSVFHFYIYYNAILEQTLIAWNCNQLLINHILWYKWMHFRIVRAFNTFSF